MTACYQSIMDVILDVCRSTKTLENVKSKLMVSIGMLQHTRSKVGYQGGVVLVSLTHSWGLWAEVKELLLEICEEAPIAHADSKAVHEVSADSVGPGELSVAREIS